MVWRTALRTTPAALCSVAPLAAYPNDELASGGQLVAALGVAAAAALSLWGCGRTMRRLGPVDPGRAGAADTVAIVLTVVFAFQVLVWPHTVESGFLYALALPEIVFAAFTVGGPRDFARRLLVGLVALVPGVFLAIGAFGLLSLVHGGLGWLAATAAGHLLVFTASGTLFATRVARLPDAWESAAP